MRINVVVHGSGVGESTHISIYTCILKGYNNHLHWPLLGTDTYEY